MRTRSLSFNSLCLIMSTLTLVFVVVSCSGEKEKESKAKAEEKKPTYEDTLNAQKDSLEIDSEYDMETVDRKHQKEFMESLAKIEEEYGEQWDFCTCIVKNDSINKATQNDLSDAEFDKLINRMDYVDNKCKAFLVQSLNKTPEERYKHEKKVKECLKEAGIN